MRRGTLQTVSGLTLVVALAAAPGAGMAQSSTTKSSADASPTPPPVQADEIVVTAQRRSESIQTVPVAVTAFSAKTISDYGIRDFSDYGKTVPGLSFGTGGSASGSSQGYGISSTRQVTIRGVAGTNTTSQYLDDTPLPAAVDIRVLDLDRIEVLRGPQGTLFGAASMGGTVRLVSAAPDLGKASGELTVQGSNMSHGGTGYDVSGVINTPLIEDSLSLRLSGYSTLTPGYLKKEYGVATIPGVAFAPGEQIIGQKDVGENHAYGGVAKLIFEPQALPNLRVTATVVYQQENIDGYTAVSGNPNSLTQYYPLNTDEKVDSDFVLYSLDVRYKTKIGSLISSTSEYHRRAFDLEDATAWIAEASPIYFGLPSPYLPASASVRFNQRTFTQELRFESDFSDRVAVTAGAFYQKTVNGYMYSFNSSGVTPTGVISTSSFVNRPNTNREISGFANIAYNITPQLKVAVGARISSQKVDQDTTFTGYLASGTTTHTHQQDLPFTPRAVVSYEFDKSNMLYASASKGFRPGGANSPIPAYCHPEQYGLPSGTPTEYESDSLWSYEVGLKNSFADRRINTRIAVYQINWNGIQQAVFVPSCGVQITQNQGAARIRGGEAEVSVAPLDGLNLSAALGYTDAAIVKAGSFQNGTTVGAPVGSPLNGVPRWNGSLRAEYSWQVGELTPFVRMQYSYTGDSKSFTSGSPLERRAYSLVDLRTGFSTDGYRLSLFANNIFDVRGNLGDVAAVVSQRLNTPQFLITTPRRVGVELMKAF